MSTPDKKEINIQQYQDNISGNIVNGKDEYHYEEYYGEPEQVSIYEKELDYNSGIS